MNHNRNVIWIALIGIGAVLLVAFLLSKPHSGGMSPEGMSSGEVSPLMAPNAGPAFPEGTPPLAPAVPVLPPEPATTPAAPVEAPPVPASPETKE